ncbi:hypothetical protein ABIA38_007318 [Embleya sp. AB8]
MIAERLRRLSGPEYFGIRGRFVEMPDLTGPFG